MRAPPAAVGVDGQTAKRAVIIVAGIGNRILAARDLAGGVAVHPEAPPNTPDAAQIIVADADEAVAADSDAARMRLGLIVRFGQRPALAAAGLPGIGAGVSPRPEVAPAHAAADDSVHRQHPAARALAIFEPGNRDRQGGKIAHAGRAQVDHRPRTGEIEPGVVFLVGIRRARR